MKRFVLIFMVVAIAVVMADTPALSRQSGSTDIAGGRGGNPFSDPQQAAGTRVTEVRIRSGEMIDAIQMVYETISGSSMDAGLHGGSGGRLNYFRLDADEYITGISGRCGDLIDSLRIHTNKKTSPLFGGSGGNRDYQILVPGGTEAVGFTGRSGQRLDAVGLIYAPLSRRLDNRTVVGSVGQMGATAVLQTQLYGGGGGYPFAPRDLPAGARIAEIRIASSDRVDSLQTIYVLPDGRTVEETRYGGSAGRQRSFRLDADEYITGISGRHSTVVNSLQIQTNKKTSPLYGGTGGTDEYHIEVPGGFQAIGFAGRSSALIDAIGLTYTQLSQNLGGTPLQTGAGQYSQTQIYGGSGGYPFSTQDIPAGARIAEIRLTASDRLDSLQTVYVLANGRTVEGTRYGALNGRSWVFRLDADEYITGLSGRCGTVVNSLQIQTNKKVSPLYGGTGGREEFRAEVPAGSRVVGFAGRSSALIDAIGLMYTPISRGIGRGYGQGYSGRQVAGPGTVQYQQTALYGGTGGNPFADQNIPAGARIAEIRISSGDRVDSVQMIYVLADGTTMEGARYGGTGGRYRSFRLDADEYITGISGRYSTMIDSLQIRTNKKNSPLFGGSGGTANFQIDVPAGSQAVGFFGRAGQYLDAIGLVHARRR